VPTTLTPLRYPGGKSKYAGLFADVISLNGLEGCTFVEAFAGGAGAAVSLLLRGHVASIILNDLDVAIFAFWKSVKDHPDELMHLIERTPVTIEEWSRQKAIHEAKDETDILALGFSTFYLNRCNRSGILRARPIGGMKQNGAYKMDARYNKRTAIAKIEAIASRAASLEVFNLDGLSLLQLLERRNSRSEYLIYFDPPYYQKGPGLYLNHFSRGDHKSLRDAILRCRFPWVLSYDAHQDIVDLYRDHDLALYRSRLRHTISGNTRAEELIISKLHMPTCLESFEAGDSGVLRWTQHA